MQFQASYNIKDLRDLLKQRKYKYTLNKIEKILQKSSQPSFYGADFQLTLRELQLSAINKLIQRNIGKKYKYSFALVEYLIELAYRNLDYCQQRLKEAVKQRTFFSHLSCGSDLTLTINSQAYSLEENFPKGQKMRNASININTGIQNEEKLSEHLVSFFSLCTESLLLMVQTFIIYKQEFDHEALLIYIESINQLKFKKTQSSLSQVHINLFYVKLLFLSAQKADLIKCEEMIESSTQKLIDIIHQININYNKAKKRDKQLAKKKYEKELKHSQRLMAINLILHNKIQLKLGKEILAVSGIAIFQGYIQDFSQKQNSFKKLLAPQLYLQDQFLRYRLQKEQLLNIITPFFRQKLKQLQQYNRQKQTSKTSLLNFYNKKNTKLTQRVSHKQKTILNDLTTAKSLIGGIVSKQKSMHLKQHKSSKEHSTSQSRSKLLTNMIMADIEQNNSNYLKNKRKTVDFFSKRENSKSSFYRSSLQLNQMKKHIVSARDERLQKQNTKQPILLGQKQQKLLVEECDHQLFINRQKQRLAKKKREVKIMDIDNIEFESKIPNKKEDTSLNNKLWNCRYSDENSNDLEERDVKRNALMIPVRKKTDMLIEILFQNKDILGLKKIAEKFDTLKKKQQQKSKLSRLTSSMSRQRRERHSFVKFEVIAKQILKKHISFVCERSPFYHATVHQQVRKKLIYSNYVLGQKSIEAVKQKLQNKIKKSDPTVDKYLKNEEIFKLKLKKIGTTNFILKKSNYEQKVITENE